MDEHDFEVAARTEQAERDQAIARARARRGERELTDATGRRVCKGCYDPLSHERLAVEPGAVRCVHCQGLLERWGR